jgi:hypothetical protein
MKGNTNVPHVKFACEVQLSKTIRMFVVCKWGLE